MNKNHLTRLIWLLVTAFLLAALSACGNSNNNSETTSVVKLPINIQKLTLPSGALTAWITVDDIQTQMTIDSVAGTASATITGLTLDTHTVLIEFKFTDSNQTILIATSSRSVDLSAGSATISFADEDYDTGYDEDQDGLSNIDELAWGKNPFGQAAFSANCFPFSLTNSFGNIVFNYDGDLLIANSTDSIQLLNHISCNVTTLVIDSAENFRAVVEDKIRNRVYAGSGSNNIFEIDPANDTSSLLANVGAFINSIVLAPPGYGSYGGQLIVGTSNGDILAIDQSVVNPSLNVISTVAGGTVSNLVFGNDGTLYATDYDDFKIVTVAADGTLTDFATMLSFPDGLAIDNSGSRLFIAESGLDKLQAADIPSGALSIIGSVNFGSGFAPSGLAYDNNDTLMMITDSIQIEARSTIPFNTSCLPLAITGTSMGAASYTSFGTGNLLFTSFSTDDIHVLNRRTCALTTLASNVSGGSLRGVTYDPGLNLIFVGASNSNIYAVDPADGSSVVLTNVVTGTQPNGLVVAPASYGIYAGQLIVALSNGGIYAIDQTQVTPTPVIINNIGGAASDLIYGSDGTLYVANHDTSSIQTLTSAGSLAVFVGGLSNPDGLAIDDIGGRLLVANSGDDTLKQVTIPGKVISTLGAVDFDDEFFPSGIFFDQYSTLLLGVGEFSQTITAFGL